MSIKLRSSPGLNLTHVQGVSLPQNYLAQPNNLESALDSLDLKGLLVLNGLITQQALKVVLAAEGVMSPFKPTEAPMAMSIANKAAYTAEKKLPKKKKK